MVPWCHGLEQSRPGFGFGFWSEPASPRASPAQPSLFSASPTSVSVAGLQPAECLMVVAVAEAGWLARARVPNRESRKKASNMGEAWPAPRIVSGLQRLFSAQAPLGRSGANA